MRRLIARDKSTPYQAIEHLGDGRSIGHYRLRDPLDRLARLLHESSEDEELRRAEAGRELGLTCEDAKLT